MFFFFFNLVRRWRPLENGQWTMDSDNDNDNASGGEVCW